MFNNDTVLTIALFVIFLGSAVLVRENEKEKRKREKEEKEKVKDRLRGLEEEVERLKKKEDSAETKS